jgi:hypothetical protein
MVGFAAVFHLSRIYGYAQWWSLADSRSRGRFRPSRDGDVLEEFTRQVSMLAAGPGLDRDLARST